MRESGSGFNGTKQEVRENVVVVLVIVVGLVVGLVVRLEFG